MNHIYKVIWSRVKNSYVVVSEIAGTARKSGRVRVSKNTLAAVLAAFLLTGISVSPVSAVLDGVNTFVEPGNQNIKIGNDIDLRNNSTKNGAIAIGDHAQIDDYVMQEGSIAIGKNAFVENMWGTQDKIFRFGFGGDFTEFVGEYDLVLKRTAWLIAEKGSVLYKNLNAKLYLLKNRKK